MQKDIYFSEKNINIGDKNRFYSPWEIYLSEFQKWKPLVRGVLRPLSSLRLENLRFVFHGCQSVKQPIFLLQAALWPPGRPLACCDTLLLRLRGRVWAHCPGFCSRWRWGPQDMQETWDTLPVRLGNKDSKRHTPCDNLPWSQAHSQPSVREMVAP